MASELSSTLDLKKGVKFFLERFDSEEPKTCVDIRYGLGLFYEKYVKWGLEASVIGSSCLSSLILSMIYFCFKPRFYRRCDECSFGSIAIAGSKFWPFYGKRTKLVDF